MTLIDAAFVGTCELLDKRSPVAATAMNGGQTGLLLSWRQRGWGMWMS
ncbi:hypothetical protein PI125_g7551 [Phytophthora idaei]|nr:hypothetical protein PI125_g7551 [Phytophthora idaei]